MVWLTSWSSTGNVLWSTFRPLNKTASFFEKKSVTANRAPPKHPLFRITAVPLLYSPSRSHSRHERNLKIRSDKSQARAIKSEAALYQPLSKIADRSPTSLTFETRLKITVVKLTGKTFWTRQEATAKIVVRIFGQQHLEIPTVSAFS